MIAGMLRSPSKKVKDSLTKIIKSILKQLIQTKEFKKILAKALEEQFDSMSEEFTKQMQEALQKLMNPDTYTKGEKGEILGIKLVPIDEEEQKKENSEKLKYIS